MRAEFIVGRVVLITEDWDCMGESHETERVISASTARRLAEELLIAADASEPSEQPATSDRCVCGEYETHFASSAANCPVHGTHNQEEG